MWSSVSGGNCKIKSFSPDILYTMSLTVGEDEHRGCERGPSYINYGEADELWCPCAGRPLPSATL